jgi:hypothetical protein
MVTIKKFHAQPTHYLCFVWIWEETAIISLYNINWLVLIADTGCLLRGTSWTFKYNSGES